MLRLTNNFHANKTVKDKLPTKISPVPKHNYMYFVKADNENGRHSFSRAYINFTNQGDVFAFKAKFDNYVFLGPNGAEYPSVVELAPFQNVPKEAHARKEDGKCGTVQDDVAYAKFVDSLKCRHDDVERPEFGLKLKGEGRVTVAVTPLLKYITERKSERKSAAERDHANSRHLAKNRNYDNCVVFVNSTARKNHLHYLRNGNRKSRFLNYN